MHVTNRRDAPSLGLELDIELIRTSGAARVLISDDEFCHADTVARRIHATVPSPRGPFITVDCASLPRNLGRMEPGRLPGRPGCTLFLKEVGKLAPDQQRHLLTTLIDGRLARGAQPVPARVIASTSEVLHDRVLDGTFDDGLFYALNLIHVNLRRD